MCVVVAVGKIKGEVGYVSFQLGKEDLWLNG